MIVPMTNSSPQSMILEKFFSIRNYFKIIQFFITHQSMGQMKKGKIK